MPAEPEASFTPIGNPMGGYTVFFHHKDDYTDAAMTFTLDRFTDAIVQILENLPPEERQKMLSRLNAAEQGA